LRTLIGAVVPATAFVLLVAVGIDVTTADFARVRQQRGLVFAGLFAPLILLPPIAVMLASVLGSPREVIAGVLVLAACPIGTVSNLYSYLARASNAVAVTLTGLSCLFAGATIPLAGRAIEFVFGIPLEINAPVAVLAAQLLILLAMPVVLGMSARHWAPAQAFRVAPTLRRLSIIGTLVMLTLIVIDDWGAFVGGLSATVPLAAAFVAASFAAGWIIAVPFSRSPGDRFAVAAEFGARNIGVATAIAVTFLGRVEFARFTATYSLVELPLMLGAAALFRAFAGRNPAA
jgi:BASS family bile acid:Na+ symporter